VGAAGAGQGARGRGKGDVGGPHSKHNQQQHPLPSAVATQAAERARAVAGRVLWGAEAAKLAAKHFHPWEAVLRKIFMPYSAASGPTGQKHVVRGNSILIH
jgi:hypothetical protein